MTASSKMDFKKIQDAIRMLGRFDMRTQLTTKVGDNPANVDATLALIENLCAVIRQQERVRIHGGQVPLDRAGRNADASLRAVPL
jgi:hypothetical protein